MEYTRECTSRASVCGCTCDHCFCKIRTSRRSNLERAKPAHGLRSKGNGLGSSRITINDSRITLCSVLLMLVARSELDIQECGRLRRVTEGIRHVELGRGFSPPAELKPLNFAELQNATLEVCISTRPGPGREQRGILGCLFSSSHQGAHIKIEHLHKDFVSTQSASEFNILNRYPCRLKVARR